MKKKLVSNTYLRGVSKYQLKISYEEDAYTVVKKIEKIDKPFILSTGLCLIDDGYTIIEILPKKEYYSIRAFLDRNNKLLQYYIDTSKENGIDEETNIPYYDDLYIDITITNQEIEVLDEDELEDALKNNKITKEEFNLAHKTKDKLLKEIKEKSNKYLNRNLEDLL